MIAISLSLPRATILAAAFATSAFASTLTFTPTKDSNAKEHFPDTNYGTDTIIQVSGKASYQKHIFAQFTVSGIPTGSTNITAQLKLTSQTTLSSDPITAHTVSNTTWGETTITWNNQPALGATLSTVSTFTAGQVAVWNVSGDVTGNGTYTIGLDGTSLSDTTFGSRESTTPPSLVVTYTPPATYNIYHGNTHAHSIYSHDSAPTNTTPDGLYSIAASSNYQYFTVTDHSQSDVFVPTSQTNAAWVASKNDGYNATTNGTFVAVAGYEHSENGQGCADTNPGTGHFTVLNTKAYTNAEDCGTDIPGFYNFLKTAQADDPNSPIVVGFNHPGTTQYNNWAYRDATLTNIITLCELVNSNDNVHEAGWRASLAAGWKTSPTSGGDTHASCCGIANDTSRAYVLATSLSRHDILDAMKNRRTYAALHDETVALTMTCNGVIMGQTLASPSTFTFAITLSSATTFNTIEIVGSQSNTAVASITVNGTSKTWNPTITNTVDKWFYVRGTRGGTAPFTPFCWSAPIWTGR